MGINSQVSLNGMYMRGKIIAIRILMLVYKTIKSANTWSITDFKSVADGIKRDDF